MFGEFFKTHVPLILHDVDRENLPFQHTAPPMLGVTQTFRTLMHWSGHMNFLLGEGLLELLEAQHLC